MKMLRRVPVKVDLLEISRLIFMPQEVSGDLKLGIYLKNYERYAKSFKYSEM